MRLILVVLLVAISAGSSFAQEGGKAGKNKDRKGEFHGLIRAGLCSSQMLGDGFGGYNKLGGTAGFGTYTRISSRFTFQIEMNYAMRGSKERSTKKTPVQANLLQKYETHYIDIPLLFKTDISFLEFEFGVVNGIYLFHTESVGRVRIRSAVHKIAFNRYELAVNLGVNVPINEKWKGNARFHYSILPAAGKRFYVPGGGVTGGAYNNALMFSVHRILSPKN